MSGKRLVQGLSMTTPEDAATMAEQSARRSSLGASGGRRPSEYGGDPIDLATRPASPLAAIQRGLPPQTKERSKSFVEERFNRESLDSMLKPPAQVVTEAIANEPEIFTLFSLRGRSAVVTGGARGLGATLASAMLEAGADAYCVDILDKPSDDEWKALQDKAKKNGVKVSYRQMDITDSNQVTEVFGAIEREIEEDSQASGQPPKYLRVLLACAGTQHEVPAFDYPHEDFDKMQRVNVTGTFITCQTAARIMARHGKSSSIMCIASMSGKIANRGVNSVAYNASKAAVAQMVRNLACEWGPYKIRVNSLSPGYVGTAMLNQLITTNPSILGNMTGGSPLGRIGRPHEFKGIAVFLASEASSFCTGMDACVDGGFTAW